MFLFIGDTLLMQTFMSVHNIQMYSDIHRVIYDEKKSYINGRLSTHEQ